MFGMGLNSGLGVVTISFWKHENEDTLLIPAEVASNYHCGYDNTVKEDAMFMLLLYSTYMFASKIKIEVSRPTTQHPWNLKIYKLERFS